MHGCVYVRVCALCVGNELRCLSDVRSYHHACDSAKVRCVITSAVAKIGDKEYPLKKNVDRAWSSISLRSKPSLGNRCCSVRSLDALSQHDKLGVPPLELQRSLSSGASASLDEEEETDEKKSKPQFVVLVSNSEGNSEGHWDPEQDFRLEEVCTAKCRHVFWVKCDILCVCVCDRRWPDTPQSLSLSTLKQNTPCLSCTHLGPRLLRYLLESGIAQLDTCSMWPYLTR